MTAGKTIILTAAGAAAAGLGVRIARSRHRRFLHPDGRSFTGELEVWGLGEPIGAELVDRPGRHPVTVRISKGAGTGPGRPDVLGVAVRVEGRGDLLLSTAGAGRLLRHVPVPRRSFDTRYGSILAYRTRAGRKVYLSAQPDLDGTALGATLESVVRAAVGGGARLLLGASDGRAGARLFGRVTLGRPLPPELDAALAFDPIRNAPDQLYPIGVVQAVRAFAYRLGQRWRGAEPLPADPGAIARTATHR